MNVRPTIFISGVTSEFDSFRNAVRDVLLTNGVFPIVQVHFPPDYREVRAMLRERIREADTVICLIGFTYGAEPQNRPDEEPRCSYTQLEYHLARELEKKVYVFLSDEKARPADPPKPHAQPQDKERSDLQLAYRAAVCGGDEIYEYFDDREYLCTRVAQLREVAEAKFKIDVGRVLQHAPEKLIGRETELARLDAVWEDSRQGKVPKANVVTMVAWGGVGKTSLVANWLASKAAENWPGYDYVYGWSFYSQGTREQGAASADTFVAAALKFFGDEAMAHSAASAWDKGARLAQLVAQRRTLLVLDGTEPLQYPPGPLAGELKDPALAALLKGLAQRNPGLCIVTTRERVEDLKSFRDSTAPEWRLQHLSTPAGVDLLKTLGVRGTEAEFANLVKDVKGHALILNLIGRFLVEAYNGDIRQRDLVKFHEADDEVQGGHAFKVMGAYEKWFATEGEKGLRQIAILRLLGLFDRPADAGCLTALRQAPSIPGLTEPW
jgi:hypothetical protein